MVNSTCKTPICFSFRSGHGLICGETSTKFDGYCIGAVASDTQMACQDIFSEYSNLVMVKDELLQETIQSNVNRLDGYNLYKLGLLYNTTMKTFMWHDGAPMIYNNFVDFPPNIEIDHACVVYDDGNSGVWISYDCSSSVYKIASLCQFGKCYFVSV